MVYAPLGFGMLATLWLVALASAAPAAPEIDSAVGLVVDNFCFRPPVLHLEARVR